MTPLYARAPKGERAVGTAPINYGKNVSILGALSSKGVVAAMTVEGATDGDVFMVFLEQVLAPELKPGDVVIMDNLSVHKIDGVCKLIEKNGAELIYLPPYSPDLSPIEPCWSKIKTFLRRQGARCKETLNQAISKALSSVTSQDACGWFNHCGYGLASA